MSTSLTLDLWRLRNAQLLIKTHFTPYKIRRFESSAISGFYQPSDILNYTTVNITRNEWCNTRYRGIGYDVTDQMLCATDNRGSRERDACRVSGSNISYFIQDQ